MPFFGRQRQDTDVFYVLSRKPSIPELIMTEKFLYQVDPDGLAPLRAEVVKVEAERKKLDDAIPVTYVFKDMPKPKQAFILKRGEYDQPGAPVDRAVPGFLAKSGPVKTRQELAKWLLAHMRSTVGTCCQSSASSTNVARCTR